MPILFSTHTCPHPNKNKRAHDKFGAFFICNFLQTLDKGKNILYNVEKYAYF